jgi:hypothetical protein
LRHRWLEVKERGSSREEKEEETVNKPKLVPWKGPLLSLLYAKGSKLHE